MIGGQPVQELVYRCIKSASAHLHPGDTRLHAYGFYIISAYALSGIRVRFHVWLKGIRRAQAPVWPPHCHRSTMTSHVLHGGLTNVTWPDLLIGFGQPLYYVVIEEGRSFLHRTPVELTLGAERREHVAAGQSYVVPKGIIHDTQVPPDGECVTMCLFHTDRSGKSLVVGAADAADRIETNRLDLSRGEAEAALSLCSRVLERIARERR